MPTMAKTIDFGDLEEIGVNTEEIKGEMKQTKKKIGKENNERTREKSKLYSSGVSLTSK